MISKKFAKPLPNCFIGKAAANQRIKNFINSKHLLLSDALGKEDTRSIWYSLKHFEDLYKELIFLNADGIRIYLGEYDNDYPDYGGQLCLVMVPTRQKGTYGHEDVILEDENEVLQRPGMERFLGKDPSKGFNYGSPCPPVCPDDDEFKYPFNEEQV